MSLIEMLEGARKASRQLSLLTAEKIDAVLESLAIRTFESKEAILEANAKDLEAMDRDNPLYDRLQLTSERIDAIIADIRNVITLPSPLGHILESTTRPNGMTINRVSVPLGVVGIIYEARPNVTFDVFSLCLKSGNVCLLKGGSDALNSNRAIVEIIREVLIQNDLDPNIATLLPADREATRSMLSATDYVDVIIPRGSRSLIDFVRDNARVPVIETGAGVCHIYFHEQGDCSKAIDIINNAKTRRVSVCNALDCLIIDRSRIEDLPTLCKRLSESNVEIYADTLAFDALTDNYPSALLHKADNQSYGREFLSYAMSVKVVEDIQEALDHIARYSSKHSEGIISEDVEATALFNASVDAACIYNNLPTSFTDGAQFGFGAEIGISTQKLHARGPMALREMTTYKYIIKGDGQIRPK